jgi:DNA primase
VSYDLRARTITSTVGIREVLAALGVPVAETAHQILCPVHPERNPSARIYPDAIYCFTCGKRYDAIALVMAIRKMAFPEALDWCEEAFGVKNPAEHLDTVLPAMLRAKSARDFSEAVLRVERLIKKNKCAMGLERYNNAWLAFDTAKQAHAKGTLDDEAFEATLVTLAEFARTTP